MLIERRGFLKIAAALGLVQYAQPLMAIEASRDWVEDRGDFYIVRIPDRKLFARERLDKPTIFHFGGPGSVMRDVDVLAFANIYGSGLIDGCRFDGSKVKTVDEDRPLVRVKSTGLRINDGSFRTGPGMTYAIEFGSGSRECSVCNSTVDASLSTASAFLVAE